MTKAKTKSKASSKKSPSKKGDKSAMGTDLIDTADKLNKFLVGMRDRMSDGSSPPIYSLGCLNHLLNDTHIYELLNDQNREVARDIWLRLQQSGFHIKAPPMLFDEGELQSLTEQ